MSMKPAPIEQDQMIEQTHQMQALVSQMRTQLSSLEGKLLKIETSMKENDSLRQTVQKQRQESFELFEQIWEKRKELYPDQHLLTLEGALTLLNPPK